MTMRTWSLRWRDGQLQRRSVSYMDWDRALARYRELRDDPSTRFLHFAEETIHRVVTTRELTPDASR